MILSKKALILYLFIFECLKHFKMKQLDCLRSYYSILFVFYSLIFLYKIHTKKKKKSK